MQRAGALKNTKNTPTVYFIQFQSASSTQGNEELASCYLPHTDTYSKYMPNERSEVSREKHPRQGTRGTVKGQLHLQILLGAFRTSIIKKCYVVCDTGVRGHGGD